MSRGHWTATPISKISRTRSNNLSKKQEQLLRFRLQFNSLARDLTRPWQRPGEFIPDVIAICNILYEIQCLTTFSFGTSRKTSMTKSKKSTSCRPASLGGLKYRCFPGVPQNERYNETLYLIEYIVYGSLYV